MNKRIKVTDRFTSNNSFKLMNVIDLRQNLFWSGCLGGYWTQFFDRDNPSGNGDYEITSYLRREYPGRLCSNPIGIDARVISTDAPYYTSGQSVVISPQDGLQCINARNSGRCLDYKVRFCCPTGEL